MVRTALFTVGLIAFETYLFWVSRPERIEDFWEQHPLLRVAWLDNFQCYRWVSRICAWLGMVFAIFIYVQQGLMKK